MARIEETNPTKGTAGSKDYAARNLLDKGANDYELRQRYMAEIASSAGLTIDRVALEIFYLLPPEFCEEYIKLFWTAFKDSGSGGGVSSRGDGIGPEATGGKKGTKKQRASRLEAAGGKNYKVYFTVISETALRQKERVDQRLKDIAADLKKDRQLKAKGQKRATGSTSSSVRCKGPKCGRFNPATANYCSNCGTKLLTGS